MCFHRQTCIQTAEQLKTVHYLSSIITGRIMQVVNNTKQRRIEIYLNLITKAKH